MGIDIEKEWGESREKTPSFLTMQTAFPSTTGGEEKTVIVDVRSR